MATALQVAEPFEPHPQISEQFTCGRPGGAPIDIYRLLTGTLDIIHPIDGRNVRCRNNFSRRKRSQGRTSDSKIAKGLFGEDVSVDDARTILAKFRSQNVSFFNKLQTELVHCVFNLKVQRNVESFLHFYRALEKLAVAFPILYISGQSDFDRAHAMLKRLLSKEGDGELTFITRFCDFIATESDVLSEYRVDFSFPGVTVGAYAALISEIRAVSGPETIDAIIEGEAGFDLPYKVVPGFLINCRNRLFHNSNTGQRNFDIDRIGGASTLCHGLVVSGLHWLSLTFVEVVRNRAGRL